MPSLTISFSPSKYLPAKNIWVNPDCGLKTRDWKETKKNNQKYDSCSNSYEGSD
ncbi:hypothetical protein [uncultured Draconibacterium sp.]|uniref:hypothetical protein n=1 Tax=uncultured Draconibacterium sp. TaxID=1573823 RepID=UPI0037498225